MRRLGLVLTCLAIVCALSLLGAASSFAASSPGCSGSAGDQQYVDPLGCPTTSTSTPPPPTTGPSTTPVPQTPSPTVAVASATSTTPTAADPKPSHGSLPYTGLDIWPVIGFGVGLFGTGVALRRLVQRS